jgi:putative GTP pyrophosphokinase
MNAVPLGWRYTSRVAEADTGLESSAWDETLITQQYVDSLPRFRRLEEEAKYVLKTAITSADIKLDSLSSRVKELDSFLTKARRKQTAKPFEEIRDIVGLRLVCLFLSDIPRLSDIIRRDFNVLSEDNKIEGQEVAAFGYMSLHYTLTLRPNYVGPRYEGITDIPLEVQVRTVAMNAWATISHHLEYKTENDVPSNLRRDFYALSGLFYVADTHFEMFYKASRESRERAALRAETNEFDLDQEINLDSLSLYLRRKFPDREHSDPDQLSGLITELTRGDYITLRPVDNAIDRALPAVLAWEKASPPTKDGKPIKFLDGGLARLSVGAVDQSFIERASKKTGVIPARFLKLVKRN